jgi:ammonia channel protein AmtB
MSVQWVLWGYSLAFGGIDSEANMFMGNLDYVGQEDEDIGLTDYTSNFGATIELDQKVYTWTDKVYITIVVFS